MRPVASTLKLRPGTPRIGLVDAVAAWAAAARAGLLPLFGQRASLNFCGRQWKFSRNACIIPNEGPYA
jgi:hypothetical protein